MKTNRYALVAKGIYWSKALTLLSLVKIIYIMYKCLKRLHRCKTEPGTRVCRLKLGCVNPRRGKSSQKTTETAQPKISGGRLQSTELVTQRVSLSSVQFEQLRFFGTPTQGASKRKILPSGATTTREKRPLEINSDARCSVSVFK